MKPEERTAAMRKVTFRMAALEAGIERRSRVAALKDRPD
jgi:hypothetical protein